MPARESFAATSTSARPAPGLRVVRPERAMALRTRASNGPAPPGVRPPIVTSIPTPRQAAPAPELVPVEHSSAYLLRNRNSLGEDELPSTSKQSMDEPFSGNAVEWMVRKADASLDEIEENPPPAAVAIYEITTGPVGVAAAKGVTTAAQVTLKVGGEALRAAAPVGKWALQQGGKAAFGLVVKSITGGGGRSSAPRRLSEAELEAQREREERKCAEREERDRARALREAQRAQQREAERAESRARREREREERDREEEAADRPARQLPQQPQRGKKESEEESIARAILEGSTPPKAKKGWW